MPDADFRRFELELKIALTLVRQRRAWIFRDLSHENRERSERARAALINEVMAVVARFDVAALEAPAKAPSTP